MKTIFKSICLAATLALASQAHSAMTPFGFELNKELATQMPQCEAQTTQMCFVPLETEAQLSSYEIRNEKNILGGRGQRVTVVTEQGIATSVLVGFSAEHFSFVGNLLLTVFGEPQSASNEGSSEGFSSVWHVEDGVITFQQATPSDPNVSLVTISTPDSFEKRLGQLLSESPQSKEVAI